MVFIILIWVFILTLKDVIQIEICGVQVMGSDQNLPPIRFVVESFQLDCTGWSCGL